MLISLLLIHFSLLFKTQTNQKFLNTQEILTGIV